ncbi:MAG: small basic protein [Puniceicoccales bacterium]|nr:small basic protein [Puniceicoccales bacterium]
MISILAFMAGGFMTRHSSLKKIGGGSTEKRTVLTRYERIELLRKRGQWSDGRRITALPKTKPEE